jgi:hypothetical protein
MPAQIVDDKAAAGDFQIIGADQLQLRKSFHVCVSKRASLKTGNGMGVGCVVGALS